MLLPLNMQSYIKGRKRILGEYDTVRNSYLHAVGDSMDTYLCQRYKQKLFLNNKNIAEN